MLKPHFTTFANYNLWADTRLYDACAGLSDEALNRDVGVFFNFLIGTLNHLVVTDRVWLSRLTGQGTHPPTLDTIITTDLAELRVLALAEANRMINWVEGISSDDLNAPFDFHNMAGEPFTQLRRESLAHLNNHQTHHRSQATTCLNILGAVPPGLDLLDFQRG
jgi:uncharacterized damage-inducible protein DinB